MWKQSSVGSWWRSVSLVSPLLLLTRRKEEINMPQLQDVVRVKIVTSGSEFVQHELNTGAWKAGDALEFATVANP